MNRNHFAKMDEISKVVQRRQHVHNEMADLKRRIGYMKTLKPVDIVVVRALALKVTDLQNELNVIEIMLSS